MMDRSPPGTGGVLSTKPNGRIGNTKSFSSRPRSSKTSSNAESKENSTASDTDGSVRSIPRPISSRTRGHRPSDSLIERRFSSLSPSIRADRGSSNTGNHNNSRDTRIPRPAVATPTADTHFRKPPKHRDRSPSPSSDRSSPMRQPMSFMTAFERALVQEQNAAGGYTDSDSTLDIQQAYNMASAEYNAMRGGMDGSPSPGPRLRRDSKGTMPSKTGAGTTTSNLNAHLQRFDRNRQLYGGDGPLKGLFTKNGAVPTIMETTSNTNKKVSDSNIGNGSGRHRPGFRDIYTGSLGRVERNETSKKELQASGTPAARVGADVPVPSIEREYVNADHPSPHRQSTFVSPEKSMGWDLDADFTAGDLQYSESPRITTGKANPSRNHQAGTPLRRAVNEKLSQIHKREVEAAGTTFLEDTPAVKPKNDRLLEIKARETEALSRRAVASSLLDEIRIKNSEPRSKSPEMRKDSDDVPREKYPASGDAGRQNTFESGSKPRGEPIQDTPIVVFKNPMDKKFVDNQDRDRENGHRRGTLSRSDSHDLLRRLAHMTSLSPKGDSNGTGDDEDVLATAKADTKQDPEARDNHSRLSQRERFRLEVKNPKDRPTVGFADLVRVPTSDFTEGTQPSKPTSEADPTERIAGELSLFAPLDNYSEKGSMRAPSPILSEPTNEETPRPPKVDPLTQPTPRVTGAYVETPATVRVQKDDAFKATVERELTGLAQDQADPVKHPGPRSSSAPTVPRRSRSSSGRRRQLINTAKPPTVREDIMSILRANNIDDSTLENLDSILADQEADDQEIKQIVDDTVRQVEEDLDKKILNKSDRERELEAYDRMSKSLQTGLLGIRSAKKGIERLEDKVTQQGDKNELTHSEAVPEAKPEAKPDPQSPSLLSGVAPVFISVPRLYTRTPNFKLTTFGLVALCAMVWYGLECAFCSLYAGPEYICTPSIPCDWSPNEPYFPYTMPFMLDEWATGGKGRALALRAGEEVGDILADISDWVTNTDFTQFDERYMDVWQRKRHRRRLRKHSLNRKWTAPPGYQARFPEWEAAKAARELAEELGFDEDDETISADEIVW